MSLEDLTGTKYINSLVATNPDGAADPKSQGDDHIRGLKNVILKTFAAITGAVTASHTELNYLTDSSNGTGLVPAGAITPYGGSTAPTGWLLCYGQAVSRTTYADLFTAISTTFGAGDGSTTFNLPDFRGRAAVGLDNLGGTSADRVTGTWADSLGGADGAETHTLTTDETPAHTHGSAGAHTHSLTYYTGSSGSGNGLLASATPTGSGAATTTTASGGAHTHASVGGGSAHNNMQPSLALTYIIKH